MTDPIQAFEETAGAARNARVVAVKAARAALNAAIKAAYADAVERAWSEYDLKLAHIWEAYEATLCGAKNAMEQQAVDQTPLLEATHRRSPNRPAVFQDGIRGAATAAS